MTLAQVQVEEERLEALHRLSILHSEQLPEFDAIVANASELLGCPISVISIVDQDEIWFKAAVGLDAKEVPRANSFCGQTILSDDVVIVPDATKDDRFRDIPLVTGDFGARFYLGCPVKVDDKHRIATICVMDTKPHSVSQADVEHIRNAARVVEGLFKAHKAGNETQDALYQVARERDKARQKQELLDKITQVSGVGGWEFEIGSGLLSWTSSTRDIHAAPEGFEPDYDAMLSFYTDESREGFEAAMDLAIRTGREFALEMRLLTDETDDRWVLVTGRPVFENGVVNRVVGSIQDISNSKRSPAEASASEHQQRSTFEALREGVLLLNQSGRIEAVNPAACELLGCEQSALDGANVRDLDIGLRDCLSSGSERVSPLLLATLEPDRVLDLEIQLTKPHSGTMKWLRISAKPLGEEKSVNTVVVSLTDITGVKQQADTLQIFFDNFPGGLVHYDSQLRLTFWNEEFSRLLDIPQSFLETSPDLPEVIQYFASRGDYGPGDPARIASERLVKFGTGGLNAYERKTRSGRVLEVRGTALPDGGNVSSFLDITARKNMEVQLVEKEKLASDRLHKLEAVIANMRQGVSVFDNKGCITLWNQHFLDLFGKSETEIKKGMSLIDVLEFEKERGEFNGDPSTFYAELKAKLDAGEVVKSTFKHPNGTIISIVRTPLPDGGWVGTHEDITSREKATEKITYAAHHDTLTGLANRTLFSLKLEEAIGRSARDEEASDLLMIDLDRFKPVNDTYGHDVGDKLLLQAATRLKECVRSNDTVARLGGDEFAIIVHNPDGEQSLASKIARRIVEKLKAPYVIDGHAIEISGSVGIASVTEHERGANSVLKKADLALYAVKHEGRDGFKFFEE
ncbi:PAS-domain containing protein [uncultured Roseibium sp.]|uniref:PAS-domain containing protein n=1 Tax=uncultured Roseibium sp. TaxID=1936171 RepID=UPI002629A32E|nr:PAS-domain containing protein [uncultured Roseibium sp.]